MDKKNRTAANQMPVKGAPKPQGGAPAPTRAGQATAASARGRQAGTPTAQTKGGQKGTSAPAPGKPITIDAQRRSKRTTIIVVCACVLAAVAVWLLVWLFACNGNSLFDPNARTGQAPYKSAEEMQAELDRTVEEGMFNISIASIIEFETGTSAGTAYIENVPGNPYNMQVTITEDQTGDVLYESGILAPNQFIEQIVLSKALPAGAYDATATFTAIDQSTYEEIGQAAAKITINVLG